MDTILGEIRTFAGMYAPQNWHFCDGSLLNISEYQTLFALIGTIYGGNGSTTFGLPDLRGRLAIGQGQGQEPTLTPRRIGSYGGSEGVSLTAAQLPAHTHAVRVSTVASGSISNPSNQTYLGTTTAGSGTAKVYVPAATTGTTSVQLDPNVIKSEGGSSLHDNIMPCMGVSYIICVRGIFPPRPS